MSTSLGKPAEIIERYSPFDTRARQKEEEERKKEEDKRKKTAKWI